MSGPLKTPPRACLHLYPRPWGERLSCLAFMQRLHPGGCAGNIPSLARWSTPPSQWPSQVTLPCPYVGEELHLGAPPQCRAPATSSHDGHQLSHLFLSQRPMVPSRGSAGSWAASLLTPPGLSPCLTPASSWLGLRPPHPHFEKPPLRGCACHPSIPLCVPRALGLGRSYIRELGLTIVHSAKVSQVWLPPSVQPQVLGGVREGSLEGTAAHTRGLERGSW